MTLQLLQPREALLLLVVLVLLCTVSTASRHQQQSAAKANANRYSSSTSSSSSSSSSNDYEGSVDGRMALSVLQFEDDDVDLDDQKPKEDQLRQGLKWAQKTVVESFGVFRMGMNGLWVDWKECNELRRRIRDEGHEMTYPDLRLLQRGKEDRNKIFGIIMVNLFVPEALPFVLGYVPAFVPTTFETKDAALTRLKKYNMLFAQASLQGVEKLFKDAKSSFVFGSQKKQARQLQRLRSNGRKLLSMISDDKVGTYRLLEHHFYVRDQGDDDDDGKTDGKRRLKKKKDAAATSFGVDYLPNDLIYSLSKALGLTFPFAPMFIARGNLNKHMQKVAEGDSYLAKYPVDELDKLELMEVCVERGIDCQTDRRQMQKGLQEWLALTNEPANPAAVQGEFAPVRAKVALLGLNVVCTVRSAEATAILRELLIGR